MDNNDEETVRITSGKRIGQSELTNETISKKESI